MYMRRFPPQDLFVFVLVIVLISSFVVEAQQVLPGVKVSSAAGNCTKDMNLDYRIRAIEADILRKLRLSNPPNVTGRRLPDIPQLYQTMERYTIQGDDYPVDSPMSVDVDDTQATTIGIMILAQTAPPVYSENWNNIFTFNFPANLDNQLVVSATMGIFIRRPTHVQSLITTFILIYRLRPLPSQERVLLHTRRVLLNDLKARGQWFTFDMKSYVESWASHMNASHIFFVIRVSDGMGESLAIVSPRNESEEVLKPYLEINVRGRGTSRPKRTIDQDCDESSAESPCCRYPVVVDFEQLRWDWVILPKRYTAYYCSGKCSLQRYPHTNLTQPAHENAGTCQCCPKKASGIRMAYYKNNKTIVYGIVPDMVIDQCGCW